MKIHKRTIVAASIMMGVVSVLLGGCASDANAKSSPEKTFKVTIPGEPMTIDPNKSIETNGAAVIDQTSEGIYRRNANNKIVPGVVEKMVKPTENKTKYTFTIKKNAKWENGKPVTSQDFVTSLQRNADPATKSQATTSTEYIKNFKAINNGKMDKSKLGVHALNNRTFYIKLERPVPYIDYEFINYRPLNTAAIKKYGSKYGSNAKMTVANGAYSIKGWTGSNDSFRYVKNPHYWDAKNVKIKNIDVKVVKEDNTAQNLFKSGEVQLTNLNGQYVKANKNNKEEVVTKNGRNNYIYFNSKRKATANESFRKAISMVIDREALAKKVLQDGSTASNNIVPKDYAKNPTNGKDFVDEVGNLAPTNVTKAKKYWKQAQKEIGKNKVNIDFLVDDTDTEKKVAEYMQSTVEKNLKGVTVSIVSVPHATHVSRDFKTDFDITTVGWGPDYPDAQNFLDGMQSENSINFSKTKDAKYDELMAKVNDTSKYTEAQRFEFEKQADKRLMDIAAVAPTFQTAQAHLLSSKIGGLKWDTLSGASGQLQYAYWK
ncbi:peptide ABC transporter substrate-binding protein [Ligilactobacillus pobuzihii]|uniref:peptide ABC transporter substrate-binding protein n=1 Tax=Ligilactobacillus pobuzihii TaxID=449659 RepID=UPI0019CF912B|nr:peptide ABC transporter substrate-binding protein [Ligilactobacillus pobuzihii]MBN7274537.1 peptide ABC transporter substrate-binding protein [Ligilactobacillus pobuzihii]